MTHLIRRRQESLDEALTEAARRSPACIVQMLLNHKANPAFESESYDARYYKQDTPFFQAMHQRDAAVIKIFLTQSPESINARDKQGWTPLFIAAQRGCVDLVELLLSTYKPDLEFQNQ